MGILVGNERDGARPVRVRFDHVWCRHPLGMAVGERLNTEPVLARNLAIIAHDLS
jgi:hypothetical protein